MNVFTISKTLGVFPFSGRELYPKWLFLYSWAVLIFTVAIWSLVMGVLIIQEYYQNEASYLNVCLHVLSQLMNIVCVAAHLVKTKHKWSFLSKLVTYLSLFKEPLRKISKYFILGTILAFGRSLPIIMVRYSEGNTRKLMEEVVYFVSSEIKMMVTIQFYAILIHIHEKLVLLVANIKPYNIDTTTHYNIVSLLKKINEIFGWQLLTTFCQIFVAIVSNGYWLIVRFSRLGKSMYHLSNVCAILFSIFEGYIIIGACQANALQVENFNVELFRLMRESKHLCENEKLYLYATIKNSITFTACGFFNLGYPLVTSIITAAATYLVILLQFSSSPGE